MYEGRFDLTDFGKDRHRVLRRRWGRGKPDEFSAAVGAASLPRATRFLPWTTDLTAPQLYRSAPGVGVPGWRSCDLANGYVRPSAGTPDTPF